MENGHSTDVTDALDREDYSSAILAVHEEQKVTRGLLDRWIRDVDHTRKTVDATALAVGHDEDARRGKATGLYAKIAAMSPSRASAHNLDAQALQRQIEAGDAETMGAIEGFKPIVANLQTAIGVEPDRVLGIKGSGVRGQLAQLRWLVVVALVAGQALPKVWELVVKWIL